MANAKLVPEGPPPDLGVVHGPASTWIPDDCEAVQAYDPDFGRDVEVQRVDEKDLGALMGKAYRHCVTGKVEIKGTGKVSDYCVADLWTRDDINGTVEAMSHDPYIFKPVPFPIRTWIYHAIFRSGMVTTDDADGSEDAIIRSVLNAFCIDVGGLSDGQWAPIMLYVPMILLLSFGADVGSTMISSVVLAISIAIQWLMNTPRFYRFTRLATFPFRIVLLILLIQGMQAKSQKETSSGMTTAGFVIAILLCVLEILVGDGQTLASYRLHCYYEVIKPLPNRLFVCRRHGAAHSSEIFGEFTPVSEKVSGIGGWQRDFALIADMKGLIVELKPMSKADWNLIFSEKQTHNNMIHRYMGLDIFSPGAATVDALNAAIDEQQMMMAKKKALELSVEDYA